jgi:hypothetical protein
MQENFFMSVTAVAVSATLGVSTLAADQTAPPMGGGYTNAIPIPVDDPTTANIAGALFKPAGVGPFPAVVYMSGCAGPSFRRRRLAGESGGGRDGYLCAWRRPRQERLQRGWAGCVRRGCDASQGKARDADCSGGEASSVRCRDGGLLRATMSG